MPDHPLTAVGGGADLYVQATEPAETPSPAPDGDGGIWYPTTQLDGGTELWSYATGDVVRSGVAIADGTAVVGSNDNSVYGLQQLTELLYQPARLSDGTSWRKPT